MPGRINELAKVKRFLEKVEPENRDQFVEMLRLSMTLFRDQQEVAEFFDVTPPTVSRWKDGKCAPYTAMRKYARDLLLARTDEKMAVETGSAQAVPA